ncbi:MAG: antibiotic biosynthesis monooxygenase [Bacteroidetes bacterium]|nr:antibiotic biosynthesis monooxygenase [Bacteroidota bacterium]
MKTITRIVKMKFRNEATGTFMEIFSANKEKIAASPGCISVELRRDLYDETLFFTISQWRSAEDLENYRKSELFTEVWERTKKLFSEKAEAWTVT